MGSCGAAGKGGGFTAMGVRAGASVACESHQWNAAPKARPASRAMAAKAKGLRGRSCSSLPNSESLIAARTCLSVTACLFSVGSFSE